MKNNKTISKLSTRTRKSQENMPVQYDRIRNKTLHQIANANVKFNFNVIVSPKPF